MSSPYFPHWFTTYPLFTCQSLPQCILSYMKLKESELTPIQRVYGICSNLLRPPMLLFFSNISRRADSKWSPNPGRKCPHDLITVQWRQWILECYLDLWEYWNLCKCISSKYLNQCPPLYHWVTLNIWQARLWLIQSKPSCNTYMSNICVLAHHMMCLNYDPFMTCDCYDHSQGMNM